MYHYAIIISKITIASVITILSFSCNDAPLNTDNKRIVVLTLDDAVKSHLTHVAPLLEEYNFRATFFVSYRWMDDTVHFLTWPEIAELHRAGFEIGNHSWTHPDFSQPDQAAELSGELGLVEWMMIQNGIPKPVSFAYTGNGFGPEAIEVLKEEGYRFARRGMQPEIPYGDRRPGPTYNPNRNHPLLIPTTRDGYPDLTFEDYVQAIECSGGDEIAVLQFHGVPDEIHPWVHTSYEMFRKVMKYLKDGNFKVIALQDLEDYLPEEIPADTLIHYRHTLKGSPGLNWPQEVKQTRLNEPFWMDNMINWHNFSAEEIQNVTGYQPDHIDSLVRIFRKVPDFESDHIKIKPYPGGRHPRIGFRDGMRSPMRGTKASIFLPWNEQDYIILDLPEAVFTQYGLTFLGHKHIPTVLDLQRVSLINQDWQVLENGNLKNLWELPNHLSIGAEIIPGRKEIDLQLSLTNYTRDTLFTNLNTQICIMFKNANGFDAPTNENKIFTCPFAIVHSEDSTKWIVTAWDNCGRSWGNEDCPCMHADPVFQDCGPGQQVQLTGKIWFFEGKDISEELERIRKEF